MLETKRVAKMIKIKIFLLILLLTQISSAKCNSGFITVKAKIIDINHKPIKDVIAFGFINNLEDIYYDKLWSGYRPNLMHQMLEKEDVFFKSNKDGDIEIKLFFHSWSGPDNPQFMPHCDERIRRIDLVFFKEGYLPARKILLQVRDNIVTDFPIEKLIIDIGTVKMKDIKSSEEIENEIFGTKK